ncbi:MAG TPA: hypothetical protein VIY29_01160 [Ktedonobacteraceae bacterium]
MIEEEIIVIESPDSDEVDIIVEEEIVVKEHVSSRKRAISAKVYAGFLHKHARIII